jgi:Ca2+-binding RTX toxin-like protein
MAADSIVGSVDGYDSLPSSTKDAIDDFLSDTANGLVVIVESSGGTVVTGTGATGEVQSVIIVNDSGTPVEVSSGGFNALISTQSSTVITVEGPGGAQGSSDDFFRDVVDSVVGTTASGAAELNASLNDAIDLVATEGSIIKIVGIIGEDDVLIDGSGSGDEVMALNLNKAGGGIIVKDLDKVIIVGSGMVTISNSDGALVAGDLRDQLIIGGSGNDTIVGGAGQDTIVGGAGEDVFGFVGGATTDTTIGDFKAGIDSLFIDIDGVDTIAELNAMATFSISGGSTTISFEDGSSLTLIGVELSALTSDLVQFSV